MRHCLCLAAMDHGAPSKTLLSRCLLHWMLSGQRHDDINGCVRMWTKGKPFYKLPVQSAWTQRLQCTDRNCPMTPDQRRHEICGVFPILGMLHMERNWNTTWKGIEICHGYMYCNKPTETHNQPNKVMPWTNCTLKDRQIALPRFCNKLSNKFTRNSQFQLIVLKHTQFDLLPNLLYITGYTTV